jgi:prepilin-type N-terminal cleavage/methylation domain-containing protein
MTGERGFTLVELLAALVAGGLLLASLGWMTSGFARRLAATPAAPTLGVEVAQAAPVLERLIAAAHARSFAPAPRRLEFVSAPPAAAGAAGPIKVVLEVRPTTGGEALHAAFAPVDPAAPWPPLARESVLVADVERISINIRDGRDDGVAPELVTLSFVRGSEVRRLSLRPRVDADGACRFDPISLACRP